MQNRYTGKKVLIFGLGLNDGGLGMAEFFLKNGALVTITDGKTQQQLSETLEKLDRYKGSITLHLGGHIKEDFLENDIIVRNPAIKPDNEWLKIARDAGKEIVMEMALFHQLAPCPIIGVTGTRGKSTTTTLIYEFLKAEYGERVFLGGNIGKSALRELDSLKNTSIAVLEISSFQLDGMGESKISPNVAVVTNIYQDHLNWHRDMDDYINSKKMIFLNQGSTDHLVVNVDNGVTKEFTKEAKGSVITFSLLDMNADYYMDKDSLTIYSSGNKVLEIKDLLLDGTHNLYNILGAYAVAKIYNVSDRSILKVLSTFKGVEGREELIRELDGIRFYNDTTATSIEAMLSMFERFGEKNRGKIVMIAGGEDKGLDYSRVIPDMKKYLKSLVLLEGPASEKIREYLSSDLDVHGLYGEFESAVKKAYELADEGDMVILCPAAASFNMFANEFDRGKQFVNLVKSL